MPVYLTWEKLGRISGIGAVFGYQKFRGQESRWHDPSTDPTSPFSRTTKTSITASRALQPVLY